MKFSLFEELGGLPLGTVITLLVAAALVITLLVALIRARKQEKRTLNGKDGVRAIVYGALCVAMSFLLSYLKLFEMPQGGSITLCSILPVAIYANWFGTRNGIIAGLALGLLQFIQKPIAVHWLQPILDYPLAFACFGLAGLFPKNLPLGIIVGGIGRILFSTVSGAVFFAEYAWEGFNPWIYSFIYNFISLGPDAAICVVVAVLPPVKRAIARMMPKEKAKAAEPALPR